MKTVPSLVTDAMKRLEAKSSVQQMCSQASVN
jgi:hypothetical protein